LSLKIRKIQSKKLIPFLILIFIGIQNTSAQNKILVSVKDGITKKPLAGANVYFKKLNIGAATNYSGLAKIENIPRGKFILTISYIAYKSKTILLKFLRKTSDRKLRVFLFPQQIKGTQIIVTSTRTNGVIEDVPIKIEVLGQNEINEEVAIKPANISKLLGETSGVFIQQTSAVSGNVDFRLEGLPGNYTQILQDGIPAVNELSAGLTLLQIPPLDLRQVEVVKGASSLFYSNGAIAGFVNLISKKPDFKPEFDLVINQTNKKGTDFSSFYSRKNGKVGFTLLASGNIQQAVDLSGNGFSDIPKYRQFSVKPKFFWYINNSTQLEAGINAFWGKRIGGDIFALENGTDLQHSYYEKNLSENFEFFSNFRKKFNSGNKLSFRNNIYYYNKNSEISGINFSGFQIYSFNELSYLINYGNHRFVLGLNLILNKFKETSQPYFKANYNYNKPVYGAFAQDNWQITPRFLIQTGLRTDYNKNNGIIIMPHFSLLWKLPYRINARFSLGTGYRIPEIISIATSREIIERFVNTYFTKLSAEKALSFNFDLGYKFIKKDFVFKINQAFFYLKIRNAVVSFNDSRLCPICGGRVFTNSGKLKTLGFDTNLYLALDELEFFADFTFNDVRKTEYLSTHLLELTPAQKLNLTLTFENEGSWKIGLEAFFIGKQYLPDFTFSPSYWLLGAMFEKSFNNFSVILNVENLLDKRQTRIENVVLPPLSSPSFRPLFMPLDGMIANIALWFKFH